MFCVHQFFILSRWFKRNSKIHFMFSPYASFRVLLKIHSEIELRICVENIGAIYNTDIISLSKPVFLKVFLKPNLFQYIFKLLTLSDPRGGPFCPLFSQSIANASWLGISVSMPDGFLSWRYINCLVKLDTFFIIELF